MNWLTEVLSLLASHAAALGIVGAAVAFIWSVWQFFDVRRREFRNREFEIYHRLIRELVQPEKDPRMFLDRQVAIVFELRHFKRYRQVSARILQGLKASWSSDQNSKRLIEEINLAIADLEGPK
ncbi:MAG: hypothetical protein WCC11_06970 [Gammaproteobacteria bacterium]